VGKVIEQHVTREEKGPKRIREKGEEILNSEANFHANHRNLKSVM
jgi:hypothetical protein